MFRTNARLGAKTWSTAARKHTASGYIVSTTTRRSCTRSENHGLPRVQSRILSNGRSLHRWREHRFVLAITDVASIAFLRFFQDDHTRRTLWPTSHGRDSSSATRMTFSMSSSPRVARSSCANHAANPPDKFMDPVPLLWLKPSG